MSGDEMHSGPRTHCATKKKCTQMDSRIKNGGVSSPKQKIRKIKNDLKPKSEKTKSKADNVNFNRTDEFIRNWSEIHIQNWNRMKENRRKIKFRINGNINKRIEAFEMKMKWSIEIKSFIFGFLSPSLFCVEFKRNRFQFSQSWADFIAFESFDAVECWIYRMFALSVCNWQCRVAWLMVAFGLNFFIGFFCYHQCDSKLV